MNNERKDWLIQPRICLLVLGAVTNHKLSSADDFLSFSHVNVLVISFPHAHIFSLIFCSFPFFYPIIRPFSNFHPYGWWHASLALHGQGPRFPSIRKTFATRLQFPCSYSRGALERKRTRPQQLRRLTSAHYFQCKNPPPTLVGQCLAIEFSLFGAHVWKNKFSSPHALGWILAVPKLMCFLQFKPTKIKLEPWSSEAWRPLNL